MSVHMLVANLSSNIAWWMRIDVMMGYQTICYYLPVLAKYEK